MHKLTATYRVATHMFLSRDGQDAEIRAPSVRGALRFWYRAMQWPRLRDWRKVREREARLFGSADRKIGQGRILVSAALGENRDFVRKGKCASTPLAYLGYGVVVRDKQSQVWRWARNAVAAGSFFTVNILFRPRGRGGDDELRRDVRDVAGALKALGLFGGLGSRSRNGLGSVNLHRLVYTDASGRERTLWKPVRDMPDLVDRQREWVDEYLGDLPEEEPSYTAFSAMSNVTTVFHRGNGMSALEELGRKLQEYRVYPKDKSNGVRARFSDDHDNMYKFAEKKNDSPAAPRRSVFGLPHNYYLSKKKVFVYISVENPAGETGNRRASPLFIHIHEFHPDGNGSAVTFTFLPAQFLPEGAMLKLEAKRKRDKKDKWETLNSALVKPTSNWAPIEHFIDEVDFGARKEVILP